MTEERVYSTGRRKTSVARVWLKPGTGQIIVNEKPLLDYFCRDILKMIIERPLEVTETIGKYDVMATVIGGGLSGQAGAVRLGIARALLKLNPDFRSLLRDKGLLTRDPREKERKKYGHAGRRKRFQYSKR
jgi:small subunit ribosomal protein S9